MKNIFKLKLKFNKDSINIKNIFSKLHHFWFKRYRVILFIVFLVVISFGGYVWYKNVYDSQWDEVKKQDYLITQGREVNFKEDKFDEIKKFVDERKVKYAGNHNRVKEIFEEVEKDK